MSASAPILERYIRAKILADLASSHILGIELTLSDLTSCADIRNQINLLDSDIKRLIELINKRVNDTRKTVDEELAADFDFDIGSWNEVIVPPKQKPKRKRSAKSGS